MNENPRRFFEQLKLNGKKYWSIEHEAYPEWSRYMGSIGQTSKITEINKQEYEASMVNADQKGFVPN